MDAAWAWTLALAALLVGIHLAVTARNGFALPETMRDVVGASPATTLTRPWSHFTAPFFHYGFGHLGYNVAILLATMPIALRSFGAGRALPAAYAISPLTGIAVNLLVILPLAALGVQAAQAAAPVPLVGASVMIFAGAGLAASAMLSGRGLGPAWSIGLVALFVAYELVLQSLGLTQHFVWLYHATGFALGSVLGRIWS